MQRTSTLLPHLAHLKLEIEKEHEMKLRSRVFVCQASDSYGINVKQTHQSTCHSELPNATTTPPVLLLTESLHPAHNLSSSPTTGGGASMFRDRVCVCRDIGRRAEDELDVDGKVASIEHDLKLSSSSSN